MYIILPKTLDEQIKACKFTPIITNKVYSFIDEIFFMTNESMIYDKENTVINSVEMRSEYLRKKYSSKYCVQFLDILLKNNIVKRTPFYNHVIADRYNGKAQQKDHCFGYYINPELMDFNGFVWIKYKEIKTIKYVKKNISSVVRDLKKLQYNIDGMLGELLKSVITDMEFNEDISDDRVEITTGGKPYFIKRDKAIAQANLKNQDLIRYKDKCYISQRDLFLQQACQKMIISQLYAITCLLNGKYYATTCASNDRLNTNLTNLKKIYIEHGYILLDGKKLVDIDLANSHPALLSYLFQTNFKGDNSIKDLMKGIVIPDIDTTQMDVKLFIASSCSGTIYEYLSKHMGWDRNKSKKAFLRTWYSRPLWAGGDKQKIKAVFPGVITWIDEFKTVNDDYTILSILLQKLESRIFIQNIYKELQRLGFTVFTKHDSILCREDQKPEIMKIMNNLLAGYGITGKLK